MHKNAKLPEGIMDLKGRDFLTLCDFDKQEIEYLLDLSARLKKMKRAGDIWAPLKGKNVALIFEKTSTRTRCAFEVAAHDLGMGTTYLDPSGSQIGKKESIADTARVLTTMFDGIEYRGFGQDIVQEIADNATVPVWNGLTNEFHPTQLLAQGTIWEIPGWWQALRWVCTLRLARRMTNIFRMRSFKVNVRSGRRKAAALSV